MLGLQGFGLPYAIAGLFMVWTQNLGWSSCSFNSATRSRVSQSRCLNFVLIKLSNFGFVFPTKIEKKLKSCSDGNVVTIFFLLIHVGVLDACFTVWFGQGVWGDDKGSLFLWVAIS